MSTVDHPSNLGPPRVLCLRRTYSVISSYPQRQSYKHEFNRDYSEYRLLHAHIDGVTQQFMELNAQLQHLSRGSCKYKVKTAALPFIWKPSLWFDHISAFLPAGGPRSSNPGLSQD